MQSGRPLSPNERSQPLVTGSDMQGEVGRDMLRCRASGTMGRIYRLDGHPFTLSFSAMGLKSHDCIMTKKHVSGYHVTPLLPEWRSDLCGRATSLSTSHSSRCICHNRIEIVNRKLIILTRLAAAERPIHSQGFHLISPCTLRVSL